MKKTIDIELNGNYVNVYIEKVDKTILRNEALNYAIETINNHLNEKELEICDDKVNLEVIKVDKTISNTEALCFAIKVLEMQITNKK